METCRADEDVNVGEDRPGREDDTRRCDRDDGFRGHGHVGGEEGFEEAPARSEAAAAGGEWRNDEGRKIRAAGEGMFHSSAEELLNVTLHGGAAERGIVDEVAAVFKNLAEGEEGDGVVNELLLLLNRNWERWYG